MQHFPDPVCFQEFVEKCLLKNEPCLFGEWVISGWGARKNWVMSDGTPNYASLMNEFGRHQPTQVIVTLPGCCAGPARVPVADCTQCRFSSHPKTEMLLCEYMDYWQSHDHANQSSHPNSSPCDQLSSNGRAKKLLYLKDWHVAL